VGMALNTLYDEQNTI